MSDEGPFPDARAVSQDHASRAESAVPARARVDLLRGLAVMAEAPEDHHAVLARALGFPSAPTPAQYSDVFLFQLYPYASVHLGPEGMMGGEARDRVAGFWRALGLTPPAEPDHLAALLGLYANLAEREASLSGAERSLTRQSRRALLEEHLTPWVFSFLARVLELADGVYSAWARVLDDALRHEVHALNGPEGVESDRPVPLHLHTAPVMSDPREEGAEAFLAALLAPVRSGVILTRADLARLAGQLDVGLRAGERRYALEHMLAQDSAGTLRGLAEEARRQGAAHEERAAVTGPSARFFVDRCAVTARLLDQLSEWEAGEEGGTVVEEAAVSDPGMGTAPGAGITEKAGA